MNSAVTYRQAIERSAHTDWTKGEVVEMQVLRSISPEYAARFRAECAASNAADVERALQLSTEILSRA